VEFEDEGVGEVQGTIVVVEMLLQIHFVQRMLYSISTTQPLSSQGGLQSGSGPV